MESEGPGASRKIRAIHGNEMQVDTRAGSNEIIEPLRKIGIDVDATILDAGDISFAGNGPDGDMLIGVEYKKLGDLIQSMRNGRFADQLRAMKQHYQISWLLIEGGIKGYHPRSPVFIRTGGKRPFKVPGNVSYHEIVSWCMTMCMQGGVLVWRTDSHEETVAWLRSLYLWWTTKEYHDHTAMLDFYQPPPIGSNPFTGPTLCQKVAVALPRVGAKKAIRASKYFRSVSAMVNATEGQWQEIDGFGKKDSATIVKAINEEE